MVAVVSGNGLGLLGGSAGVLGSGGQTGTAGLGQAGEGAWINAKTGNLLLQRQDELLAGRGPDIGVVRTYNSQGGFDFDNGDSWQLSLYRKLASLTGTVNTANSTIKRFEADGSQLTYTYDATLGKYVNRDGSGAYDTLSYDSAGNTWTWRDGDSGLAETFEASPTAGEWRITSVADRDGNTLTYGYDTTSGLITSVQTANGETTLLQYNASRQLTRIDIVTAGNVTTTRVRYEYDSNSPSRLTKVITDLTPQDGSVADNNTFVTTYTYHGTTTRVASITHGDGTQLSFTYDASGRVQTYTDGSGAVTTLTYNSGNTTVTDALGQVTTLHYDSNGNLTRLQGPAGSGQNVQYAYNARGDVTQVTDSRGNVTQYSYDSQGNRIREQDAAGTVIERDYNASNQLVRQTVYAVADPDGVTGSQQATQPQTSHYIYDANQRLRFAVSPEGRVTEYRYDGYGQQNSVIQHAGTIDLASLATLNYSQDFNSDRTGIGPSTLPAGIAWSNGALAFTSTQQATSAWPNAYGSYFPLGTNWQFEVTTPATISAGLLSAGIASSSFGTASYRRHRAYFSNGRIYATSYTGATSHSNRDLGLAKPNTTYVVDVRTENSGGSTLYVYEKGTSPASGAVDRMWWPDWTQAQFSAETMHSAGSAGGTSAPGSTNTIVLDNLSVTTQAGLSTLETWSASQDQRGSQRTDYVYDARGLLRQTTGYALITAEGLGTIASNTYYVRDAAGRVLQSIDAWGMSALSSSSNADLLYQQDSAGRLTGVVFDKVTGQVKNVSARDTVVNHLTTYVHDGLGRLIYKALPSGLGQAGYAEQTLYDGANRRVTVVQSDGLRRVSAYDQRGLLVSQQEQNSAQAVLSGTSYQYDSLGRLRAVTDAVGGKSYYLYDSAGRQSGYIDAAGALTEFLYNANAQVTRSVRYASAVSASLGTLFAPDANQVIANVELSSVRPASTDNDQIARTIYDEAGRERFRVDARGFVVESRYDGAGRLTQTLAYARALTNVAGLAALGREARASDIALLDAAPAEGQIGIYRDPSNDRVTRRLYDGDGLLRGELDGVGYLTEYRYDALGRMTQYVRHAGLTDSAHRASGTLEQLLSSSALLSSAGNNLNQYFIYNSLGQLAGEIDAERYYTRHRYDANGNRVESTRYATRADVGRLTNAVTPVTVKLRLSGTAQGGVYPQVQVKIDGTVVGTITLNSTAAKDYTLSVSGFIPGRDHNVSLVYLNDTGVVGTEDRNLFLHSYNLTTPVVVQNASWGGVQVPGNTDLTIAVWSAADGLLPYGGETQTTNYSYTVRNQLASRLDADGTMNLFVYDALGRMVSSSTGWTLSNGRSGSLVATDVRGQQQRYDLQGRLTGELSALGVAALEALGASPTQAQIDAVWATYGTHHEYDAAGRRTRTTDANGNQTLYFYDAMGRITYSVRRVRNPANASEWVGEVSKREYNALGQLTRERQMATFISATKLATLTGGAQSQITAGGVPTETTNDRVLDYTYHLTGEVRSTKTYLDAATSQTQTVTNYYTGFGQLQSRYIQQVAGRSRQDQFGYDRRGLLTWNRQDAQWGDSTSGSGANANAYVISQGFNAFGHLASRIDARGVTERYGYDKLGRQIAVRTDPDDATGTPELNRLRQVAFDAFDRVIKQTDALGQITTYSYDTANRTVTVTTPEGIVTKTTRNRHGEVITLVDGLGNESRFEYDKNGNLVSEKRWDKTTGVETTVATHGYDTAGLLKLSETDANGNVVAYTYDAAGRMLTRRVDPTGLDLTTTYQYDAKGQAVKVTDANGNVTQTTFDRSGRVIEVAVDPTGLNLRTRYEYDLDGHVLTLTEGYGTSDARRTAYEYDNLGRRTKQVVDPDAAGYTGLKLTTTWTYDGNDNVVARIDGVGTPEVRTTRYTYDALNRLTDTIDALGGVTRNEYDLEGRIVRTTAYAQAINMATFGAPGTYTLPLVTALLNQTDPNNRVTLFAYDEDGRLRFVIDALGAVTERQYDAAGNLTAQVRYANALAGTLAANTLPQVVSSAASSGAWVVTSTADRKSSYSYDAFNRVATVIDAAGTVTRNVYDAAGNLTDSTIADGTPLASTVHRVYDKAGRVASETRAYGEAEASTTLYGYDALGNQTSIVEAFGTAAARTTIQEFDKAGRKTAAVDGAGARTTTTYNARGDIIKVTDALGNTGYFYTDALGRVTLQVDPEGAVTETRYDALGNVTETFRYANKVVGAVSETARPQILAAAGTGIYVVTSAADQRQQVFHDLLGRKSEIRTWYDSAYYSETFTYDVQGNVLTAKARNGAITTYAYDVLGRKTLETLPIESRNASNQSVAVKNSFAYDVLGNLVQKTEAVGLPEQRITTYAYDKLNRQVMETGQSFTTYDPISNTSSTATPVKQKLYDALGNLVEETDPRGRRTLHYYDAQGREIGRIDGAGTYTVWTYDAADNRIGQTVHANQVALSGSATLSNTSAPQLLSAPPLPGTNAVYVVLDSANDRSVAYTHDGAGRQTGTRIDNVTGGAYDPDVGGGTYQVSTGSISTTTVHDAMGNVVRSVDGNGNVTRSYFNKAGQQVGQLDANKYLTVWARDTAGNVIQETRYANAVAATLTVTDGTGLATLIGNVAASSDDRITLYVYDKLNRIVSQTQKNVAGGTVNTSNGVLAESTADAVTQYTYDGLNNVTRQIDASSAITDWTYDSMGRKRREQKSGYVDHLGVSVRPTTDTEYDGLNQVKREILRGTNDSLETDDRITVYTYVGGFLASVTDANGAVIQYGVDANGNVTKRTLKNRGNADNVLVDDVTTYHYDSLNRQVKSTDVSTSATQEMRYNAFGEITGKRTNNGGAQVAWPEFALYDRAGRAWMSTAGDGVTKVYLHDANGNATQTLASTTDLSGLSLAEVLARTDTLKTISVFDGRNQLTETFEVPFEVGQQLVAIAANTANQSVFVANGSAITIGPAATIQDTTPPTTPTPALSSVSTTGAPISVSVTGSNIPENVKDSPRYNQRVSATVTLPANLPGTGNIRAQLSVSRPTYYRHVDNSGEATRTSYSYSPTPDGKLDQVTAISAPAYSATSVVVAQGSAQISIAAQSARDAYIVGAQTYTLTLYQQTANGDVPIGTVSGTVNSSGTTYAATMTPPRRLAFNGQPTAATSLLMAYRAQGSTGPWTWLSIPAQTNTGGAAIPGSFALDWTSLAGGNYEYQYYAIDSSGAIVNQQTGNLNLTNTTAPGISQNTGALGGMGGAGRGLVSVDGKLNLYGLANSAVSVTVSYRIKGSGGVWTTVTPAPTKHTSLAGWFHLPYDGTFQSNTTYELDIVAKDGSGNVVSRSRADFSRDGSGSPAISAFTAYQQLPALVRLAERADTAYADISYRSAGSTGAFTTVRVAPTTAGSGLLEWDASALVADSRLSYDYEVNITAYSAGHIKNNETSATLRLGATPAVFAQTVVATNAAVTVTPAPSAINSTVPTTAPSANGVTSTTGAPISVSVTGSNIPENVKDSPRYNQRVSATVTLPANLPGTGNIRAQLSVSRPTYYRHVDNSGEATRTSYSYSPTPDGKLDQVTAISAPAYSATSVVVAQGSAQISIAAQSARDAYIVGAQTYTLTLYQQTANGDVPIGTVSGTVNSSGTTYAATMTPPRRLAFNGQPTAATSLLMAYRAQGSTGPWTWLSIPAQTNTGGAAIPGSFALDWTSLAGGNYEYQYYAIDSSGAIVNQQTGNLNLTNTTAPGISQNTGALGGMGGAGRGLVSVDGKLNLYGLANSAVSVTVSYRIKGSGGVWTTVTPAPTKHTSLAGWFHLPYDGTFQSNTTYELDIVAKDGSGNVVSRSRADFSRDGSGSPAISAFTAYNPQASIVTITTLTNTAYVEVAYRTVGDLDPTYSTVRVNPTAAGSGVFLWDASGLVTNVLTDADYELVIKSYDADGAMLGSNDVTLRLGPNATLIGIQTQNMPLTLRVTPPQANSASIRLGFRLKGSNDIYTEVAGTASGGEFRLSLAGIPLPASGSVDYEYVYDAFDANGALLGRNNGVFTLNPNSTVANRLDWVIGNVGSSTVTIHKQQRINAFGEVIQEIDGLGRVTDLSYNTLGKLIRKEDPQTDVTRANGFVQRARPTTRFVYDFSGRLIATIDPNGNTNTQVWLAGGQEDEVVLERHADTGLVTHKYDIFGDKRIDIDALGYQTEIAYDKLGQIVQIKRPQRAAGTPGNAGTTAIQAIDSYTYDAAGNRITHTNALGDTERTYFDSLGRVTRSKSFAGFSTTYAYTYANTIAGLGNKQVGGWQKTTTDAVGRSLIDKADIFGRVTWHQDLGGHTFNYTYNAAGWLINQVGSSGQNIQTDYYANGNIKSVWDKALGTYASYRYDAAGNRTFEGYVTLRNPSDANGGIKDYYQYADIEYDELNRLKRVRDPKADIRYEYDAAGNRRHVTSTYSDGVNGSIRTQDYWYVYDAMNRFTVTMGILSTGARGGSAADTSVSIVKGTTGVAISYDLGGQRRQAANGSDGTVEDYSYSAEGYLADVKINNVLKSRRTLDLAGRVTYYAEYAANGSTVNYYRNTTYDKDSRVLSQSGTDGTTTNTYYVDATDTTASQTGGGALARSVNVNGSTITSYYAYEYWDTAKEMAVTTQGWNAALKGNNAYWRPGYAYHTYDVNGHLAQAIDAGADGAVGNADDRTFRYINDAQGLTLMRDEIAGTHVNRIERYYYANGVRVGDVGNDGPSRTDYVQAIAGRKTDPRKYKNWEPVGSADFDQNYEPVSPSYPGPTPSSYTVRNGDTLQNIARSVWGDGSLWYLIADANGLSGNEILKAGATLTLPNKITNLHNNAGTFRPYNPGEVIGDTSPTLPAAPPPPRKKKCGGLAIIVVAVVAVVATVLTAGALAPAAVTSATAATGVTGLAATWASGMAVLGGAGFATGGLAAAAIGGAVGSVAGQLTGMALGVQDKFSWGAVATAALTTALAPKITPFDGKSGWAIAGNAAARSMVNQGINIVTGQQKGFSWAGVAASAIAAPVMHKVGNALFGESDPLGNRTEQWTKDSPLVAAAAESTVNALISATAHIAIVGGKVQWSAVAADSISGFIQSRALINAIQSGPSVQLPEVVATEAKTNPAVAALYRKTVDDFRAGGIDADKAQELALQGFDLRKSFDDKQALDAYKIDVLTASGVSANSAKRFLNDMGLITSQPPHALVPLSEGDSGDIVAPISLPPVTIEGERGAGFSVTGRFLFDWQNELAAVGTASQKLSQWIDGNPALGWALMAVQAATTPMLFAGQQALQHSPVGEMLNSITGAVFEDVTKFVDDEGVIGDRGKAALMTVGGISALSLTVGGISALRNSVSSVRSAFSTMRAKFARHERFDSIDAFVRATNDPAPKTLYSLGGVEWKTDGLGRFDVVEGPVNLNPVGRNDPLLQRRIGYTSPYDTDVGFHVWPDQWGGPTSMINVVPGNGKRTGDGQRNLNNGAYADFEREVTALVRQQGNNVQVRITAGYNEGNSSRRPDVFNLTYRVNGGEWELPTRLENKW
jgi:YD repeat-containing protein